MDLKKPHLLRVLKYLASAVGLLIVAGLVLALVAVKILDSDDYRRLAAWGVAQTGDTRMVVDGIFEVEWSRTLRLTATDIRFEGQADGAPPVLSIGRFHIRMAPVHLLRGIFLVKNLEIDGLRLTHQGSDARDAPPAALEWPLGFLTPVVERMALNNHQFLFRGANQEAGHHIFLQRLLLDDRVDEGPLFLQG
nr:hypothetical protein [Desulfobacterales bacterium]